MFKNTTIKTTFLKKPSSFQKSYKRNILKSLSFLILPTVVIFFLSADSNVKLRDRFNGKFYIGAAVAAGEWGGYNTFNSVGDNVMSEFNSVSAENCMKPELIQPRPGTFQWGPADNVVYNAQRLGMVVRGHTFIWHRATPSWMTKGSKEEVRSIMKNHIETLAGRYRGSIYAWDVVNEALADGAGTYRKDSPWYKAYGDESYIVDAFDFAKAADPNAKLIYNDYCLVIPDKRQKAVKMIKELKLKEHGLSGVGIQAHWSMTWPSVSEIQKTIDTFSRMGLDVQITELDIDCYNNGTDKQKPYDKKMAQKLAKRYGEIFRVLEKNSDKISSVTFWGVADDHSWLHTFNGNSGNIPYRENYPLLFDRNYQKKDAYFEIIK